MKRSRHREADTRGLLSGIRQWDGDLSQEFEESRVGFAMLSAEGNSAARFSDRVFFGK